MTRRAPPLAFLFLHTGTAWPLGVVTLAMGSGLVKAGVPVHQVAGVIAAASLPFSFEFVWAPMVDASFTRRRWYVGGATVMCACLAALLVAPWNSESVPLMRVLAFCSSSGAALAAVAIKGLMAYDVPAARLGVASGFYTAGGILGKTGAAAVTIWLLAHLSSRPLVATLSTGAAALAAVAILLASSGPAVSPRELPAKLRAAMTDLWNFIRTRNSALIAVLCVVPFGSGTESGLIGAIAREWSITADQLAAWITLSAIASIAGAVFSGWLSTRMGPWNAYILQGWAMIAAVLGLAWAPRTPLSFFALELLYRGLASACYAALLAIVMTAIGKGAASTKAAAMWSLANFAFTYPTLIEGAVHDRAGTNAMLLTDAGLAVLGFGVLMVAARLLKLGFKSPVAAPAATSA